MSHCSSTCSVAYRTRATLLIIVAGLAALSCCTERDSSSCYENEVIDGSEYGLDREGDAEDFQQPAQARCRTITVNGLASLHQQVRGAAASIAEGEDVKLQLRPDLISSTSALWVVGYEISITPRDLDSYNLPTRTRSEIVSSFDGAIDHPVFLVVNLATNELKTADLSPRVVVKNGLLIGNLEDRILISRAVDDPLVIISK